MTTDVVCDNSLPVRGSDVVDEIYLKLVPRFV